MNATELFYIQKDIGYNFHHPNLLKQAFTRKSYAEEHLGTLHNEVLEFYGDKALEMIVMKKMASFFGGINESEEYSSKLEEGELTEIKKGLINKSMLAHRIELMRIEQFLLMGNGDIQQNANEEESVKEDLFEAIVGAVAIDSNWNIDCIEKVVDSMHDINHYLENGVTSKNTVLDKMNEEPMDDSMPFFTYSEKDGQFTATFFKDGEAVSTGTGHDPDVAQQNAINNWYLENEVRIIVEKINEAIGEPQYEKAINQLQELFQKKIIGIASYSFNETYDNQGNSIWECKCSVEGIEKNTVTYGSSKKECKKEAAFKMLEQITTF